MEQPPISPTKPPFLGPDWIPDTCRLFSWPEATSIEPLAPVTAPQRERRSSARAADKADEKEICAWGRFASEMPGGCRLLPQSQLLSWACKPWIARIRIFVDHCQRGDQWGVVVAVDRTLWAASFSDSLPHWPCPTCGKGFLSISPDKLAIEETGPSKAAHAHEAWEPEWIENRFVGFLECSMPACKELVTVSGTSGISHDQVDWDEWVTTQHFKVAMLSPAPMAISYPEKTPQPIVDALGKASMLFWSSPESAANHIRQSVEALMDDAGFPEKAPSGGFVALHNRIENFQNTDKENGDVLLATKWLGNGGSHVGGVSRDDVLDAFDMIEFVLENRYGTTKAELMAKVAAVNAAKGPVKSP